MNTTTGWNWFDQQTVGWSGLDWTVAGLMSVAAVAVLWMLVKRLSRRGDDRRADVKQSDEKQTDEAAGIAAGSPRSDKVSWSKRTLFTRTDPGKSSALPRLEPHEIPTADTGDLVFGKLTLVLAELFPESPPKRKTLQKELVAAGFLNPHAWQNLAAIRYVAMMVPLIFFGGLLLIAPVALELPLLILMAVFCGAGWALPRLYVRNKAADRTRSIEHAMPDMLDMLHMCVSQGLTVQSSLLRISRELQRVYPHLARELSIVCEQAAVGTLQQALQNFAERIDVPEVQSFTSLFIQTERMGTSVSQALTEYSDNFRETQRQQADQKANNATFKLLFPTVFCLMPAVYLFLLGPAIIELSDFFYGGGRDALDSGRQALQQLNQ